MNEVAVAETGRPTAMSSPKPFRAYLLILFTALVTFAPICSHPFLSWDDDHTIEQNPLLQHPSLANALHYWHEPFMDLYVPVTYALWSALAGISVAISHGKLDPRVFHAASVLLHATNAALVLWLLRRLLGATWPAVAGALLFALHPVQVETVAWTSGMKDLLCGTFTLLALTQYLLSLDLAMPELRRRAHYAFGLAAMLLGMLSKPTAIVTPLLIVVLDALLLGRPWRAVIRSAWPFFILAAPCIVWTKLCQPQQSLQPGPLWRRPIIAIDAIAFYLYKITLPVQLSYDYGHNPNAVWKNGWMYWTWIVPAAAAAAVWYFRTQHKPLAAALLLLVAGVAPVLGLIPFDYQLISTVADHYLYIAILGPALAAAWIATRTRPRIAISASAIALSFLALRTADQERYWRNSETMFVHAIEINRESWMSFFKLGYLSQVEGQRLLDAGAKSAQERREARDRFASAAEFYAQALRLNPNSVISYHNYATTLMYFGRFSEAADTLAQVIRHRALLPPSDQLKYNDDADLLGQCLFNLGRYSDATRAFDAARHLNPTPAGAEEHFRRALAAVHSSDRKILSDTR
jgi:tetratricopeptide (TPR) repeat protein